MIGPRRSLRPLSPAFAKSQIGHSSEACELQRGRMRSGPLFVLKDTIDDSKIAANGTLVRSKRLARLEAVLLISRTPLSPKKVAQQAGLVCGKEAQQLIELLNTSYDMTNSAFRIERTATGFLMMTRPTLVTWLDRLHQRQSQMKLSQPMMETLTIVAYQQPITRAAVESIRGVQSSDMIRQLIDRSLVRVGGEEDSLGRPFLYVTTRQFLDMFGLGRVEDLPDYETIGRQREVKMVGDEDLSEAADAEPTSADESTSPESEDPADQQAA